MKKYEAMVLSCMDPRFQPKVYKYLKARKLTGKYSAFTIVKALYFPVSFLAFRYL